MNSTGIIIKREYLSRVKKRTFIIMTILGPILFAALMVVPVWLATIEDEEEKTICVIDDSLLFYDRFESSELLKFVYSPGMDIDSALALMEAGEYYGVLQIPHSIIEAGAVKTKFFSTKQPGASLQLEIKKDMEKWLEDIKLHVKGAELGLEKAELANVIKSIETNVIVDTEVVKNGERKRTSTDLSMIIGYIAGFMIYMFVFMYGTQVMRGVIEEKSNRIVEVIVSSVKPFQLMMGKIIGIAMVGLTQFVLWILLTFGIVTAVQFAFQDKLAGFQQTPQMEQMSSSSSQIGDIPVDGMLDVKIQEAITALQGLDIPLIIISFLIYFLFGYLLYAGMFAAVGSAVDNEADTQQFMLPISLPLVLGLIMMFNVINNPESGLAMWFSMIPFTSPIVMMVRIPFGVPFWQLALSWSILIATFVFMVWLSGKIYRTGILMYGKKVSYKELWKWIRFKN